MKILTANHIAYCQFKWATQEKIPLEDYTKGIQGYAKRVEDNIFNNELHPETLKEYERGKGHELNGKSITDKILIFPVGKGSTAGSYQLYELAYYKKAPKAIINIQADPVVAVGAIISDIPMVDKLDQNPLEIIKTGDTLEVDADQGIVKVRSKSK